MNIRNRRNCLWTRHEPYRIRPFPITAGLVCWSAQFDITLVERRRLRFVVMEPFSLIISRWFIKLKFLFVGLRSKVVEGVSGTLADSAGIVKFGLWSEFNDFQRKINRNRKIARYPSCPLKSLLMDCDGRDSYWQLCFWKGQVVYQVIGDLVLNCQYKNKTIITKLTRCVKAFGERRAEVDNIRSYSHIWVWMHFNEKNVHHILGGLSASALVGGTALAKEWAEARAKVTNAVSVEAFMLSKGREIETVLQKIVWRLRIELCYSIVRLRRGDWKSIYSPSSAADNSWHHNARVYCSRRGFRENWHAMSRTHVSEHSNAGWRLIWALVRKIGELCINHLTIDQIFKSLLDTTEIIVPFKGSELVPSISQVYISELSPNPKIAFHATSWGVKGKTNSLILLISRLRSTIIE